MADFNGEQSDCAGVKLLHTFYLCDGVGVRRLRIERAIHELARVWIGDPPQRIHSDQNRALPNANKMQDRNLGAILKPNMVYAFHGHHKKNRNQHATYTGNLGLSIHWM